MKTIFKSYSESQFLRNLAEDVHGVLIRRKRVVGWCDCAGLFG